MSKLNIVNESRQRLIEEVIVARIGKKMVVLSEPRQCGKTTLARRILQRREGGHFSWDVPAHRRARRYEDLS